MPHLRLEQSANLPPEIASDGLLRDLHGVLERVAGIRISNCKSRVLTASRFFVGRGEADSAFVHLDVRFLEGRSREVRREVGSELLRILAAAYDGARPDLQITVEIVEIDRAMYFKHPAGTLTPLDRGSSGDG